MNRTLLYLTLFYFSFSSSLFADMFPFQTIEKANKAYANGEFKKSVRLFTTLDKKDVSVAYNRANAYYKAGMYELAERSYLQAKGVDEAMRMYNLGNVYFQKREFEKAIDAYERSLEFKEDEDSRFNLKLAKQKREKSPKKRITVNKASKENKKIDKELTHLLTQLSKKKIPTMLYRIKSEHKEQGNSNPW